MIVSFAWTTDEYVRGLKDVTRRNWADEYAAKFVPGTFHSAYDKSPRFGGKAVGVFEVVSIAREALQRMLDDRAYGLDECRREGGRWKTPEEFVRMFRENGGREDPHRLEFRPVHGEDVRCGECASPMVLRAWDGKTYYSCVRWPECRGAHGAAGSRPLGRPGDRETRAARLRAHASFDRLWRPTEGGTMGRNAAYALMRSELGFSEREGHLGMMNVADCERVRAWADDVVSKRDRR